MSLRSPTKHPMAE